MRCKICSRETITEYCELHERAYENIVQKYNVCMHAYPPILSCALSRIADSLHSLHKKTSCHSIISIPVPSEAKKSLNEPSSIFGTFQGLHDSL